MERKPLLAIIILITLFTPLVRLERTQAQASPSISIIANPAHINLQVGGSANAQITIASVNGFAGTVSLQGVAYPYPQVNVTLNPASVTVPAGGTAVTTATVLQIAPRHLSHTRSEYVPATITRRATSTPQSHPDPRPRQTFS